MIIDDGFSVTDNNGAVLTIRATSSLDANVYAENRLTVRNVAKLAGETVEVYTADENNNFSETAVKIGNMEAAQVKNTGTTKSENGKIIVETSTAKKVEISPVYSF